MKKVVLISQHGWPPKNNAQILRMSSLAKNLPKYGWEPVVIARKTKNYEIQDLTLAREVEDIKSYFYEGFLPFRARISQMLRWFFIPDVFLIDLIVNFRKIEKIIKKESPNLIFVSTPPSGLIIGYLLSKKLSLPLLIDYADFWTVSSRYRPPTRWHRLFDETLEKKIISHSIVVTGVSDTQIREISSKFKKDGVFFWVPNGFKESTFKREHIRNEADTIFLYAGTIYRDFDLSFLDIFRDVVRSNPELRKRFRVIFIGNIAPNKQIEIQKAKEDFFVEREKVSSRESVINRLLCANVLLVSFYRKYDYDKDILTSRIPEYIRSKRPIMAFIDKNTLISKVITKAGTGFVFDEGDDDKVKEFIIKAIQGEITTRPNMEYIMRFEWENIAKKLARAMGEAINE